MVDEFDGWRYIDMGSSQEEMRRPPGRAGSRLNRGHTGTDSTIWGGMVQNQQSLGMSTMLEGNGSINWQTQKHVAAQTT
jgi:hypothetical protein